MTKRSRYVMVFAVLAIATGLRLFTDDRTGATPQFVSPTDTLYAQLELEISSDALERDGFGGVSGITVDHFGHVYLSSFRNKDVLVVGLRGAAPTIIDGSFGNDLTAPTGPVISRQGYLLVRDLRDVKRFSPEIRRGPATRYFGRFAGPGIPDWRSTQASRVDRDGRFYFPHLVRGALDVGDRHVYLRFDESGKLVDTVYVPSEESASQNPYIETPVGPRFISALNALPFTPRAAWDVTPEGTVVSGIGREYSIVESNPRGDVIRRFGRDVPTERVPLHVYRDSLAALRGRIDAIGVHVEDLRGITSETRALRLPEAYPAYIDIVTASDGTVWVRRWPFPDDASSTIFDVFDHERRYRGPVYLPVALLANPAPVISNGMIVGLAATGTDTVLVRLQVPEN